MNENGKIEIGRERWRRKKKEKRADGINFVALNTHQLAYILFRSLIINFLIIKLYFWFSTHSFFLFNCKHDSLVCTLYPLPLIKHAHDHFNSVSLFHPSILSLSLSLSLANPPLVRLVKSCSTYLHQKIVQFYFFLSSYFFQFYLYLTTFLTSWVNRMKNSNRWNKE